MTYASKGGFTRLFAHPWTPDDSYDPEVAEALRTFLHLNNVMKEQAKRACYVEWEVWKLGFRSCITWKEPPQEVLQRLDFNLILINYSDFETVSANVPYEIHDTKLISETNPITAWASW